MNPTAQSDRGSDSNGVLVGVLLVCFAGLKTAARARNALESAMQANGDVVLDTLVVRVNDKQKASVYDPRRVKAGVLTALVTWGIFGLLTGGGVRGLISSGILGAVLGGIGGYVMEHVVTKAELARIGAHLPASSSALVVFTKSAQPERQLGAAAGQKPMVSSVAAISNVLAATVFRDPTDAGVSTPSASDAANRQDQAGSLHMILVRYPDPGQASEVAARFTEQQASLKETGQIELISSTSADGKHRVSDPTHGSAAVAKSNIVSWGVLGLIIGAIAGATGGGGILGFLGGSLATGFGYAVFGALAGVLYGLYAGRAISNEQAKSIGPLVPPGSSMILAWAEGSSTEKALSALRQPDSDALALGFIPIASGAVLGVRSGSASTA